MQKAILEFAGSALDSYSSEFNPESLRAPIHALLGEFWNFPTRIETEAWGNYPYSDDQTEACIHKLAEPFGMTDWLRSVYRAKMTPPHRAGWIAGGLMMSPKPVQWTLPPAVKIASWFQPANRFNSNT
jgi:hypothetical protein